MNALLAEMSGLAQTAPHAYELKVKPAELPSVCQRLSTALGAQLIDMVAADLRHDSGGFGLYYIFSAPPEFITVHTIVTPENPVFPSVTPVIPAAHWYEREARDLFGIVPEGHPDPRRLVLHRDWPTDLYPLRKDFSLDLWPDRLPEPHAYYEVEGEGVFVVPVGPIHAGIIEPGHFRFSTVGEFIINLEARLFYTHRGIEKSCEGRDPNWVVLAVERTCGVCVVSHALSFCQAVESIAGCMVPLRAQYLRTLAMEMERLYNHIGDVANICAGVGAALGNMCGSKIKESLLALNEETFGHRYLRGVCIPGGVVADLDTSTLDRISTTLRTAEFEFRHLTEILLADDSFLERVRTTGRLSAAIAKDLGVVGVAARASGINRDSRRDHPHLIYDRLQFKVPQYGEGDVWARIKVRIDEAQQSFSMIRQVLSALPQGPIHQPLSTLQPGRIGLGWSESARGDNLHWVRTGADGSIDRLRIRSASYCNWPAVPFAVPGNIVPDFPLINKSFELCYACTDR